MPDEPPVAVDTVDQRLLNQLQAGLSLSPAPFDDLAARMGVSADDVIARTRRLKDSGVIRQISAIFDTASLGYASSLVAARIPPAGIARAAEIINQHPGVTHNYRRSHEYNLWFTVAVPPASRLGLAGTVDILRARSGAGVMRLMPTLRLFKIGVQLDMTGGDEDEPRGPADEAEAYTEADRARAARFPLSAEDIAIIRVLQQDMPIERFPFAAWAYQAQMGVESLLAVARLLLERRQMRRFAAVLHHRAAGFAANVMGAWAVPAERIDDVGRLFSAFRAVSHCYLRPTYPDWPYNVFTMIHARSAADCEAELAALRRASGLERLAALYSLQEYKKTRLRYFTGEVEAWEASVQAT